MQGDTERARTIFENILTNYPKRVDLWNVYLDQEIRLADVSIIRSLFERVITLPLSSKKMKHFFKRYLDFEKTEGTPETVAHVTAKAKEYVQAGKQAA
jgi:rRNA biogenesis protein RRP5